MSGYWGMGIYHPKTKENVGTLWRTAHNLGASYIFTIGHRYRHQASDTTKAWRTLPLYSYQSFDDFHSTLPHECRLVAVEFPHKRARAVNNYVHPDQAVYLLGAEDYGLPDKILDRVHSIIHIPSKMCLNVAVAGSIIAYDRMVKRGAL